MNNRYVRIIITCIIVGIVMLVLRKKSDTPLPTKKCEINVTPLQNGAAISVIEDESPHDWANQEIEAQEEDNDDGNDDDENEDTAQVNEEEDNDEDEPEQSVTHQSPPAESRILQAITHTGNTAMATTITLNPEITSKDLSYKHGIFHYSPTAITLTVNGEELEINNTDPIIVKIDASNTVTTDCKYKFIAGHSGEKISKQKVKPGETYTVTFDWKAPEKIQLDGAEVIFAKNASELAQENNEDKTKISK